MHHRSYCSRVKEQRSADMTHVDDALRTSRIYHVEVMMTEFCNICIERNYVDKMIDLPWNSEEEKHLHKSLFDSAREMPTDPCGSLLVVFYLRRYRYLEAYEVDRSLQRFEQKKLETATEEVASTIRTIAQWRERLVAKCLDMLPEVQREYIKAINSGEQSQFAQTAQMSSPVSQVFKSQNPAIELGSSFTPVLQNKSSLHSKNINALTDSGGVIRSGCSEFGRKIPSILQSRTLTQGPLTSNIRSTPGGSQNGESPFLRGNKEIISTKGESGFKKGIKPTDHDSRPMYFNLSSGDTPMKNYRTSFMKTEDNRTTPFQGKNSVGKGEFYFGSRAEKPFILSGTGIAQNGLSKLGGNTGFHEDHIHKTKVPTKENIFSKKSSVDEAAAGKGGSRWRSDESSEDEDDKGTNIESGASIGTRRRPRFSRR
uniref:HOS1 n=1 Tax=Arundo donax TaxID=35708 RepID=A0A0A8XUU2_ARUDO